MVIGTTSIKISLRKAVEADIPFLFQLYRDTIGGTWTKTDFSLCLTRGYSNKLLTIFVSGTAQGFIMYCGVKPEADLLNISVSPPLHNMGIGMQAMKLFFKQIWRLGFEKIFLEVRSTSPAVRFYQRCGFIQTGTRREYYSDGVDALLMQKTLS